MTIRLLIFFQILWISLEVNVRAQLLPEDRQRIISNLDSLRYRTRQRAIDDILKDSIWEAIPKLRENIWKQPYALQEYYLTALLKFHDSSVDSLAHRIIDSADVLANRPLEFLY